MPFACDRCGILGTTKDSMDNANKADPTMTPWFYDYVRAMIIASMISKASWDEVQRFEQHLVWATPHRVGAALPVGAVE
eukprot:1532346-Amphidinium_carterae.1